MSNVIDLSEYRKGKEPPKTHTQQQADQDARNDGPSDPERCLLGHRRSNALQPPSPIMTGRSGQKVSTGPTTGPNNLLT